MKQDATSERLFRLMLRAFPKHFRSRFEGELLDVFREQRADPAYRGRLGAFVFWKEILGDWAVTVVASRRVGTRARASTRDEKGGTVGSATKLTGGVVMDRVIQDLRFAVRSLTRAPGFTVVAVLTLAIGIGSNAAVFGVVKSVLMEPLPYGEPDRVVTIWSQWSGFPKTWVSRSEYRTYVTQTRSFEDLALWGEVDVTFTDPENPERVAAVGTTENLIDVLGVEMQAGRFFTRDEAIRTDSLPAEVIVISYEAWQRRWNGEPGVVGTTTEMNGRMREVIGVLPEGFRLPTQFSTAEVADIYFPQYVPRTAVTDYPEGGGSHGEFIVARLRPGVTPDAARTDVESAIRRVGNYPPERAFRPLLFTAQEDVFGGIRPALMALLATVGFVLLIACANVANLMLARSENRAEELAVRTALGAGRGRLVAQLLVESLVLAGTGGALGLGLAMGGVDLFKRLNPGNLPRVDEVALDPGVLLMVVFVSLGTALLFGVLPALKTTRSGPASRMSRRGARGVGGAGWQGSLVAAETALAVTLVIGAGLMARTFNELTSIEPGFEIGRTLTLAVSLPTTRYPDAATAASFYRETMAEIADLPGVRSVGAIRSLPLVGQIGDWGLDIEGYDESVNPRAAGDWQIVAPGYFETMGIPLVEGRPIAWSDDEDAGPVAIVNETFVRTYWPNVEPLGRTFDMSGTRVTVVGVAGDVRHNGLTSEIKAKFYIPVTQWGPVTRGIPTSMRLVVATAGDPAALAGAVRSVVRRRDPSLAVAEVRTVEDVLYSAVAQPRFLVVLMGAFSAIALLLALVGVYGVISYGVGKRTQEIGVRLALGAMHDEVVSLMVRKGAAMVAVGLAAGTVLAFGLSRYMESLLYGVSPTDPMTFAGVIIGFAAVAWTATWIPSRRAARIDPIRALKSD